MAGRKRSISQSEELGEESASEYGQRENCFLNHQQSPFRFSSCASQVPQLKDPKDVQGLVIQQGLRNIKLPNLSPIVETLDPGNIYEEAWGIGPSKGYSSSSSLSIQWPTSTLKTLGLPLEIVDVGSNTAQDVREHLQLMEFRRSSSFANHWLPLCSTYDNKEELGFSQHCERRYFLLLRQLHCESIHTTDTALKFETETTGPDTLRDDMNPSVNDLFHTEYDTGQPYALFTRRNENLTVTPPLSPVSYDFDPFVPNEGTCTIDLTSEPDSPVNENTSRLQKALENGLDSGPVTPEAYKQLVSLSSPFLPLPTHPSAQELRVDVPLVSEVSPDKTPGGGFAEKVGLGLCPVEEGNAPPRDSHCSNFFDDSLAVTLEACHSRAMLLADQEQFDPYDSISRVPVPRLNFSLTPPDTSNYKNSRELFVGMREEAPATFNIPVEECSANLSRTLKWRPVSRNSSDQLLRECLEALSDEGQGLLTSPPSSQLAISGVVPPSSGPTVLELQDDFELDGLEERGDDGPHDHQMNLITEDQFSETNDTTLKGHSQDLAPPLYQLLNTNQKEIINMTGSFLPQLNSAASTSNLVSSFMELRAAKELDMKKNERLQSDATTSNMTSNRSIHFRSAIDVAQNPEIKLKPSLPMCPVLGRPNEYGSFYVSLDLESQVLHQLEQFWPQNHLFDRECSMSNMMSLDLNGSGQEEKSPSSREADIALTPVVGVIISSFVKTKQKPLPGSSSLPEIRARIMAASQLYESLFVLVSENNPSGEYVGTLNASDMAAYASFISFTTSLQASVVTQFVPGGRTSVARWVLSLMYRYNSCALRYKRFLTEHESTWTRFLRRTGLNMMAAQVLSAHLFEEQGKEALAQFIAMPAEERIVKYADFLGGPKGLLKVNSVLGPSWDETKNSMI